MSRRTVAPVLVFVLVTTLFTGTASADQVTGASQVYAGLYSAVWDPDHPTADLDGLAGVSGKRVTFGGTFHDIFEDEGVQTATWSNTREHLRHTWISQSTPFANVTINATAAAIAAGGYDAQIAKWAGKVKEYLDLRGDSVANEIPNVIIAPLQEANGTWTPYGCDAANFKLAYQRFVDIANGVFGAAHPQVRWAWAPNGWTDPSCGRLADFYPGDASVDIVGFSAYNFGTCVPRSDIWAPSAYWVLNDPIQQIESITPTKPIIVAQTGAPAEADCGGGPHGGQDAWVRDLFTYLASQPNVVGFVYFNRNNTYYPGTTTRFETDWRVWNGTSATQGWIDGMQLATTKYRWPLTDWFTDGQLAIEPPPGPCPDGHGVSPKIGGGDLCDTAVFADQYGQWHRLRGLRAGDVVDVFYYGNPGDIPFTGDWDCDGTRTPGLYRQSDGFVYLRNANSVGTADIRFFFGNPGDVPVPGDFNGDGCDTLSIYRPSEGKFYIMNELGQDELGLGTAEFDFFFGNPGDTAFYGDFNGDGKTEVGLYRTKTGYVYFRNTLTTGAADLEFFYGDPGDVILAGDWDGDGDDTVGVYRPSNGYVYLNFDNAPGAADYTLFVGSYRGAFAGLTPAPAIQESARRCRWVL